MGNSLFRLAVIDIAVLAVSLVGCKGNSPNDFRTDDDTDTTHTDTETGSDTDTGTNTGTDTGTQTETDTGTQTEIDTTGCGNGVIDPGLEEACDDGNSLPGDGCSALCDEVENGFACSTPGQDCVSTVVCGDGKITGQEGCDDGNKKSLDGCSETCAVESGWSCPIPGQRCVAAECGDSLIAGKEECDDGNDEPLDGCSDSCKLEEGWACADVGQPCHATVCNDKVKEGFEPCDDGNNVVGDGCTPFCQVEPSCDNGPCSSSCGDGMILPGDAEECDDGNTKSGDGCDSTCHIEAGFDCDMVAMALPDVLEVPVTFRDFVSLPTGGSTRHPDFERFSGSQATPGLVEPDLDENGKPVYTGICEEGVAVGPPCPYGAQTTSADNFAMWYSDVPGTTPTKVEKLALAKQGATNTYFLATGAFYPWDNDGWVAQGKELQAQGHIGTATHNFGFTSEVRYWFEYAGDESLTFSGDDDVWVFIAGKLALDLGGLHPQRSASFVLDAAKATELGLKVGLIYEAALFHAERHTNASNFNLTLAGFASQHSACATVCGDGILAGDEVCDDRVNDGTYGHCLAGCTGRGPHCGDGQVQPAGGEVCDDGINLWVWSPTGAPGCAPGCVLGSYCGDGAIDGLFGEECDEGVPTAACTQDCSLGERCGDGEVQEGEECDDGNTVSGDGCDSTCQYEVPI